MDTILIERNIVEGNQSLELISYYNFEDFNKSSKKVKIVIDRDSYDSQSKAVSFVLTDNGWKPIYSIPYQKMSAIVNNISPYERDLTKLEKALRSDEQKILDYTEILLG